MAFDLSLTEEQEALVDLARDFTKNEVMPAAAELDEKGEFSHELLKKAREIYEGTSQIQRVVIARNLFGRR